MTSLIITEAASGSPGPGGSELVLSDGTSELNLIGTTASGVKMFEFAPPLFTYENTYAAGADTVGRRRVRSVAQNAEGSVRVWVHGDATTAAAFYGYIADLEALVRSAHENRGTLRYKAPGATTSTTYYLESIWISDKPQVGYLLIDRHQEVELTFECRPNI
jgi:hypothetical protein